MKTTHLIALGAAIALWSGCIPSVDPYYRDQDLTYSSQLLGQWAEKGKSENSETWEFEPAGDKLYKLTVTDKDAKKGTFRAHLFKLEGELYLDLIPADCQFAPTQADLVGWAVFPGHLLMRVPTIGPELKLASFDFDWLGKFLEANPKALAHRLEEKQILLTASTGDLQRFVLEHRGENQLFQKPGELVRSGDSQRPTRVQ